MHLVVGLHGNMRAQAGFTLIEVLIVVALIAVLAGVSAPVVAGAMARYNLNSAAQQVTSTVRSARFQAVGKNLDLRVRFNFPAGGQYQIVEPDNTPVGAVQTLPAGVSVVAPADIQITPEGRMGAAANITVTDGNAALNRTISVTLAGRVSLQ